MISVYGESSIYGDDESVTNLKFNQITPRVNLISNSNSTCVCKNYTADNSTWLLPDNKGCKYCLDTCINNLCYCFDKQTCDAIDKNKSAWFFIANQGLSAKGMN